MLRDFKFFDGNLEELPHCKLLIMTINAHSYNMSCRDASFRQALEQCDVLLPDGASIVYASRLFGGPRLVKIAGADLFLHEMNRLQHSGGRVMFLGSSPSTLSKIKERAGREYPGVEVHVFSPPYKPVFTENEEREMVDAVKNVSPDVLFVGMTAPKQEKWAHRLAPGLEAGHICCIGAVFDFYARTVMRAPVWMIRMDVEWLYRLIREPRRLWKRYLLGNTEFLARMAYELCLRRKHCKSREPI
jgi:N-acetylglucosaminyldiphosphoundecaprenol N-acetyl-beta-D-mannosaminyltransferase